MSAELTAICDVCKQPIPHGKGSLYVLFREINALTEKREAIPDTPSLDFEALFGLPVPPRWHMRHDACQGDHRELASYEIAVEQIASWPKLVEWTSHLMDKRWLSETTWSGVLGSIARGDGPLVPAQQPAGSPR